MKKVIPALGAGAVVAIAAVATLTTSGPASTMADSASICWNRLARGVSVEGGCIGLGVSPRVDTVRLLSAAAATTSRPFPIGPFDLFKSSWNQPDVLGFSGGVLYASPGGILKLLAGLKANKVSAWLKLTGEGHGDTSGTDAYRTAGKFDLPKWKKAVDAYRPYADSLKKAVGEGWVLGYNMLDEPNHSTWGPPGTITKPLLDTMALYAKGLLPTVPIGVSAPYYWRAGERYKVVDFLVPQTWKTTIPIRAWVDSAVAAAKRDGVALVLSFNLRGQPVKPGCILYQGACTATPDEAEQALLVMVAEPYVCGVTFWRYDANLWALPDYASRLQRVAWLGSHRPQKPCRRQA